MLQGIALFVCGAQVEVFTVFAVLAEKQPTERIHVPGLAETVTTTDTCNSAICMELCCSFFFSTPVAKRD